TIFLVTLPRRCAAWASISSSSVPASSVAARLDNASGWRPKAFQAGIGCGRWPSTDLAGRSSPPGGCTPILASGATRAPVDALHPAPISHPRRRRTGRDVPLARPRPDEPPTWHDPSRHRSLSHEERTKLLRVVGGEAGDPKLPGPPVLQSQGVGFSR